MAKAKREKDGGVPETTGAAPDTAPKAASLRADVPTSANNPDGPIQKPKTTAGVKIKGTSKQSFECADLVLLGRIIRWIRKNKAEVEGITQAELADLMGEVIGRPVDQATVSRIESGDRAMSLPTFTALSQAVGIPGNCLLMLAIREFGDDDRLEKLIREVQDEVSKKYLGLSYTKLILDLHSR